VDHAKRQKITPRYTEIHQCGFILEVPERSSGQ
jgi:hypothetical protein